MMTLIILYDKLVIAKEFGVQQSKRELAES